MWVGLIQSKFQTEASQEEKMSQDCGISSCTSFQPANLPDTYQMCSPHNCVSQFLNINMYLFKQPYNRYPIDRNIYLDRDKPRDRCMPVKSLQSYLTLCDPVDWSLPGFSVHGILQARILDWVAISSFRGPSQPRDGTYIFMSPALAGQVLYH